MRCDITKRCNIAKMIEYIFLLRKYILIMNNYLFIFSHNNLLSLNKLFCVSFSVHFTQVSQATHTFICELVHPCTHTLKRSQSTKKWIPLREALAGQRVFYSKLRKCRDPCGCFGFEWTMMPQWCFAVSFIERAFPWAGIRMSRLALEWSCRAGPCSSDTNAIGCL